ncbi:hypothetical protein Taro_043797, partial [Colocasia esculenta]|nr:hypothetical protein [Colocasia esculenta]
VQTLFAKEVSTHPSMVSTQHLRLKGKKVKNCLDCVDTSPEAGRHELQIPGFTLLRSTHSQGRSTLDPAPRTTIFITRIAGRHNAKAGRQWILLPEQLFSEPGEQPLGLTKTQVKKKKTRNPQALRVRKSASWPTILKKRTCELETEITELHEENENLLNLIDELKLASQKASQEFKNLTEKLEIEKQEKQQKIEEIETLKNQLKERDEVIQTFTKGQDNLEALLGTTMTTTSHGLGFNKKKPMKDKSGEKKGKIPLIKFVKGPNLENTEIQQTTNKTLNKTQNKAKTQKQKKTIRSTQSPDRSTCSTSKAANNSTKNSNKNLKYKKKSKEIIHEKLWTSKTTFQDDWTNPWSQWYENPCWYHPQFLYPNFLMYQQNLWIPPPHLNSNFQMKNSPPTQNKNLGAFIPKRKNKHKKVENTN